MSGLRLTPPNLKKKMYFLVMGNNDEDMERLVILSRIIDHYQ